MIQLNKYIVIEGKPVLFPCELIHADIAGHNKAKVESAGFFLLRKAAGGTTVICSGESDSLSIASRPEIDQRLIAKYLGFN